MNLVEIRRGYANTPLTKDSIESNPVKQFTKWFDHAMKAELMEPNAMILATSTGTGKPSQRTVLLKYFDEKGFVFFTNYKSKKSEHIEANKHVSLLFPWHEIKRQVSIIGTAEKISPIESAKYFLSRPVGSQLGAWVSHQSQVISSRNLLESKLAEMKRKWSEGKIPVPDFWGGYRITPTSIEFQQERPDCIYDRIRYLKKRNGWNISRLSP